MLPEEADLRRESSGRRRNPIYLDDRRHSFPFFGLSVFFSSVSLLRILVFHFSSHSCSERKKHQVRGARGEWEMRRDTRGREAQTAKNNERRWRKEGEQRKTIESTKLETLLLWNFEVLVKRLLRFFSTSSHVFSSPRVLSLRPVFQGRYGFHYSVLLFYFRQPEDGLVSSEVKWGTENQNEDDFIG